MTDKQLIVDGVDVSGCEYYYNKECRCVLDCLNYATGKPILELYNRTLNTEFEQCKNNTNCYFKQLKRKEQECGELKEKLNPKLKNAHCTYFEGQTGLCRAKEFIKCNPVNCKLYTIDELSTIVELQAQLDQLKAENEKLKQWQTDAENILKTQLDNFDKVENRYKQALDEIEGLTQATLDEFENDDKEQQLSYCKDISEQILNIIKKTKDGK